MRGGAARHARRRVGGGDVGGAARSDATPATRGDARLQAREPRHRRASPLRAEIATAGGHLLLARRRVGQRGESAFGKNAARRLRVRLLPVDVVDPTPPARHRATRRRTSDEHGLDEHGLDPHAYGGVMWKDLPQETSAARAARDRPAATPASQGVRPATTTSTRRASVSAVGNTRTPPPPVEAGRRGVERRARRRPPQHDGARLGQPLEGEPVPARRRAPRDPIRPGCRRTTRGRRERESKLKIELQYSELLAVAVRGRAMRDTLALAGPLAFIAIAVHQRRRFRIFPQRRRQRSARPCHGDGRSTRTRSRAAFGLLVPVVSFGALDAC